MMWVLSTQSSSSFQLVYSMHMHRFNAVTYQPTLYLFVAVSIDCMAMPCLEIDKVRTRIAAFS